MNKITHHEELTNEAVRDLVGKAGRNHSSNMHLEDRQGFRQMLVDRVEKAKAELATFDEGTGWRAIMKNFGWDLWDVSDHVNYDQRTYVDFVGTRAELAEAYPAHDQAKVSP